jgi:hypothetical protein
LSDVFIDKVARTFFSFEPAHHEVRILGGAPESKYQCVYDWIMTLSERPGTEPEKFAALRRFIRAVLPNSELNSRLLDYERSTGTTRKLADEVPSSFAGEFDEACRVLSASPKASAALSRRLLQRLIREKAGIQAPTLDSEIQQVLDSRALPSYLADAVDAVRVLGNFAAHPIKSKNTGEIIAVEPGEAEWLLDVIEGLFDFYFVQPMRLQARKDALNEKLKAAGKPLLKSAPRAT